MRALRWWLGCGALVLVTGMSGWGATWAAGPATGRDFVVLEAWFVPSEWSPPVFDLVLVDAADGRMLQVLPMVPQATGLVNPREVKSLRFKAANTPIVSSGARYLAYSRINSGPRYERRHSVAYAWDLGSGQVRLALKNARVLALLGEAGDHAALLVRTELENVEEFQVHNLVTGQVVFREHIEFGQRLRAYALGSGRYAVAEVDGRGGFVIWDHALQSLRRVPMPAAVLESSRRPDPLATESPEHVVVTDDGRWLAFVASVHPQDPGKPPDSVLHAYPLFKDGAGGEVDGAASKRIRLTTMKEGESVFRRPTEEIQQVLQLLPGPRPDEVVVMMPGAFAIVDVAEGRTVAEWAAVRWMARREDACGGALRSRQQVASCQVWRSLTRGVGLRAIAEWRYYAETQPLDGSPVISPGRRWLAQWDRYADHAVVWDLSQRPPVETSPARADDSDPRSLPLSRPEHSDRLADPRVYRDPELSFSRLGRALLGAMGGARAVSRNIGESPQGTVTLLELDGGDRVAAVQLPVPDYLLRRAESSSQNDFALCAADLSLCASLALRGLNDEAGDDWLVPGCFEGGHDEACLRVAEWRGNAPDRRDDSLLARALLCPGGVAGDSPRPQLLGHCEQLRNVRQHLPPASHWRAVCMGEQAGRCRAAAMLVDRVLGDPVAAEDIAAMGCERGERAACGFTGTR